MAAGNELHLVVPGACGPLAETGSLQNDAVIKHWIRTLSRAQNNRSTPGIQSVIASLFNLSIKGDFPAAALCLLAQDRYNAALSYMCADPVHLQADLERAILTSSVDLDISEKESLALCGDLNRHFTEDEFRFLRTGKDSWFVVSQRKIQINTTPLVEATGRNVNFILPRGEDSAYWKQVLTEAQMLMHSHEVNEEREGRGMQSINSLWFHGCGDLPEFSACPVTSVCSDDDVFKGLAKHVQCDYRSRMASAGEYLDYVLSCGGAGVHVLHMADLEHRVNYADVGLWLQKLAEVVADWIDPVIKLANKNNIRVFLHPCNEKQYRFSKYDALKFWRQQKLEQHVNSY